jgi:hypothetical protein
VYAHPGATFGSSDGVDIAMIFVAPGTTGTDISRLPWIRYGSGRLNLFEGTVFDLTSKNVIAFGYGPTVAGGGNTVLSTGTKNIILVGPIEYEGFAINGAGTVCRGDSGGPDFLRVANRFAENWFLTGIHSKYLHPSDSDTGCGLADLQPSTPNFRDWVTTMGGNCPTTTRVGPCAF